MFKKSLLVASVLGVGAVVSGVAFADASLSSTYCKPGFYAGVQAGNGNTHTSTNDVLPEAQTYVAAAEPGTIFGASRIDDTGTAGRVFAGYQFNPYFALEAGYTQFNKTTFSARSFTAGVPQNAFRGEVTEHATDAVGKLTMPFQSGFGAYLKAGLAYVASDRHVNASAYTLSGTAYPVETFYTKSYQAVRATYGVGIDYTIPNTSLDIDLSYSEIASGNGIPRAGLAALGISDKFA